MQVNRPEGAPSYAGMPTFMQVPLVLDESELRETDVAILGAPVDDLVTHRPGARFGPRAIRSATDMSQPRIWHMDLGVDPFEVLRVADHGDADVRPMSPEHNLTAIERSTRAIRRVGAVPVVLGGDHSISYATIKAVSGEVGDLAVLHFDTHADTATENWGHPRAHGTPFRHLVEEGILAGSRLVQVGLRGHWPHPEEFAWMREAGIRWFRMDEVAERGIAAVTDDALAHLQGAGGLFLSVDIDVLDPAFAPGTGTPEPGGMTSRELLTAVRRAVVEMDLAGMDLVEVCPPYDHADITAMAAHRVVLEAICALAVRRAGSKPAPELS